MPDFQTSSPTKQSKKNEKFKDAEHPALISFELNKSREWLKCILEAIGHFDNQSGISSSQLITAFVSPSGGTYGSDASFSPAINSHIENIFILIETQEYKEQKDQILKLNVIRRAFQKKMSSNKK